MQWIATALLSRGERHCCCLDCSVCDHWRLYLVSAQALAWVSVLASDVEVAPTVSTRSGRGSWALVVSWPLRAPSEWMTLPGRKTLLPLQAPLQESHADRQYRSAGPTAPVSGRGSYRERTALEASGRAQRKLITQTQA